MRRLVVVKDPVRYRATMCAVRCYGGSLEVFWGGHWETPSPPVKTRPDTALQSIISETYEAWRNGPRTLPAPWNRNAVY